MESNYKRMYEDFFDYGHFNIRAISETAVYISWNDNNSSVVVGIDYINPIVRQYGTWKEQI